MGRLTGLGVAAAAAFVALAGLVDAGALTDVDRYAVHHLMPWAQFGPVHLVDIRTVFVPETRPGLGGTLVALWTYPASPLVSGVIVLACAWLLDRSGRRRAAVVAAALWVAANCIELAGKLILSRPFVGQPGFDHSFPSGHTVRAFVVAAVVAAVWRRGAPFAVAWAIGVACALVAIGDHVPTDVVGGALLAACLVAVCGELRGRVPRLP